MDVAYPYADAGARRALLYRLPVGEPPQRLLVVGTGAVAQEIAAGWHGPVQLMSAAALAASWQAHEGAFDAVAWPGLGDSEGHMLPLARSVLAPRGLLLGHFEQRVTLRRLHLALLPAGSLRSPAGCVRALEGAGYEEPAVWYVQPSISSPMGLIPTEPVAARAQFLRAIRSAHGHHSTVAYALRWLLAWAGLGGLQQNELFFWARKPC